MNRPMHPLIAPLFLLSLCFSTAWARGDEMAGGGPGAGASQSDGWTTLWSGGDPMESGEFASTGGGWQERDDMLVPREKKGGDLVTTRAFEHFELEFDFKAPARGRSAVVYRANRWKYPDAPDFEITGSTHKDASKPLLRTGAMGELYPPTADAGKPDGEWNSARIVAIGDQIEHYLNGVRVVEADLKSDEWNRRLQARFRMGDDLRKRAGFGRARGLIILQQGEVNVAFRNIRIRRLDEAGEPMAFEDVVDPAVADTERNWQPGLSLYIYQLERDASPGELPVEGQTPNIAKRVEAAVLKSSDLEGIDGPFMAVFDGSIEVPTELPYVIRYDGDSGDWRPYATIGTTPVLRPEWNRTGEQEFTLGRGWRPFKMIVIGRTGRGGSGGKILAFRTGLTGTRQMSGVSSDHLRTIEPPVYVTSPGPKRAQRPTLERGPGGPGDAQPLIGVHPGYDLYQARPASFEPRVTGIDFLPDGRLAILSWTKRRGDGLKAQQTGELYLLTGVQGSNPQAIKVEKITDRLDDPMGLCVVDGDIYISEKFRLSRWHESSDGKWTDTTIAEGWPGSGNFHEFSFGLVKQKGVFWIALSSAINQGGATSDPQPVKDRGSVITIDPDTGEWTIVASGIRACNGIGVGPDGEVFGGDNQGGWLPSSKINHYRQGAFFGHFTNPPTEFQNGTPNEPGAWDAPAVWLPQGEIGRSPGGFAMFPDDSPFAGQMALTDVAYGGLRRVYLEKVNGEYQGSVMRFTQGLEAGTNRILWHDGAFYIGGIGRGDEQNWGWKRTLHGLQKLVPNGKSTFEILRAEARNDGLVLRFTQPVNREQAAKPESYHAEQWYYQPTKNYGGRKIDEETLEVQSVTVSDDGKSVFLKLPDMKEHIHGRVVYVRLRGLYSADGEFPWATEVWYTLTRRPEAKGPGF